MKTVLNNEKIQFGTILRIMLSLLPLLFGMPSVAMVLCAYNISMTFLMLGPANAILGGLSSFLFSMLFYATVGGEETQGLFLGLQAVLCAAACVYVTANKQDFFQGVYLAAAAYLLVSAADLSMLSAKAGQSIAQYLTEAPFALMKEQLAELTENTIDSVEIVNKLLTYAEHTIRLLIPSILVVSSVIVGYCVMWCVTAALRKTPISTGHSFAKLKMPRSAAIALPTALVMYFFTKNTDFGYLFINIFVILAALFFFCAVALVDFYLRKVVKATFARVLIHFLIYSVFSLLVSINPFINIFIVYVLSACVDSFVDFRHIRKERAVNYEKE